MEIDIRLAGVQLGPYSIKQVREYLDEGLLSGADQAKIHGSDQWITVTEMLASAESGAPTEAETEPLPPKGGPIADPTLEPKVGEEPAAAAEPRTGEQPQSAETAPATPETEAPRRAPPPGPRVTLPSRLKEPERPPTPSAVEAQAKKTILIGPTSPTRPAPSGRTGYSVATTTPLTQTSAAIRKTARAAMVKSLAEQSAATAPIPAISPKPPASPKPPTKIPSTKFPSASQLAPATPTGPTAPAAPATPPAAQTEGVTPGPGQADQAKPRQALLKSLTAKTVPMRSNAAPPLPASGAMPTTTPLPTKAAFRPGSGTVPPAASSQRPPTGSVSPPSVVDDLTKKLGERVEQPEPIKKTEPLRKPARPPEPPPPHEEPKVETVKIPLKKIKAPEKGAASADKVDETEAEETEAKRPKPKRSLMPLIVAAAVVALLAVLYFGSAVYAASQLHDALTKGNASGLEATVDFPAVRDSLKDQVETALKPNAGSPAVSDAIEMIDKSIELFVTPSGIAGLVSNPGKFTEDDLHDTVSFGVASRIFLAFNGQPVQSQQWSSLTDYDMQIDGAKLHLKLGGLGWKLKQVDLPASLLAAPAAGTVSPMLQPVVDTYMERGDAQARAGDWSGAIAAYSTVLAIDSKSGAAYSARGAARQAKGDLDGANKDFTEALAIDPQMATAYNGRGNVKLARNDLDGAIADFTQALHIDPDLAAAYDGRGNAKTAKEDLEGAIADYSQAIRIDPNFASAYSDLGFARQANGNLDGAIDAYTKAIDLKPKTAMVYYNRGLARQSQGNFEAAIVDFDRALAFDPKNAQALFNRGQAKSATHNLDGAIADYTQAIALNPKLALAYCYRGVAKQTKADLDGAEIDYTTALTIDPKIAIAYYNRGRIRQIKGDSDGAIADSSRALDLDPKNWQAYFDRGFAKMVKGTLDSAQDDLKIFCDSSARDNQSDLARIYLWIIQKLLKSNTDADQALADALENNWNGSPDDLSSKTAAFLLGRISESDYLTSAASTDPAKEPLQRCETCYYAAVKRLLMGDKQTATEYFNNAVATGQAQNREYLLAQAALKSLTEAAPSAPIQPAPAPSSPPPPPATTPNPAPTAPPSLAPPANQ